MWRHISGTAIHCHIQPARKQRWPPAAALLQNMSMWQCIILSSNGSLNIGMKGRQIRIFPTRGSSRYNSWTPISLLPGCMEDWNLKQFAKKTYQVGLLYQILPVDDAICHFFFCLIVGLPPFPPSLHNGGIFLKKMKEPCI